MGYQVYLTIDEFSLHSKKTLPHMLREEILTMSIADEENLYVFPDDISVNIANPKDLAELRSLFPNQEVYIAMGSGCGEERLSYRMEPCENSIHSFNHIVLAKEMPRMWMLNLRSKFHPITGEVIHLKLKKYYEDISSTKIRDNIDMGAGYFQPADPIVQNYIYDHNLYSREL